MYSNGGSRVASRAVCPAKSKSFYILQSSVFAPHDQIEIVDLPVN
jgi:hypothetical protein